MAIPPWIAFALVKRGQNRRFTYGYGRAEDISGAIVVLVISASAVVGFIGNELVGLAITVAILFRILSPANALQRLDGDQRKSDRLGIG